MVSAAVAVFHLLALVESIAACQVYHHYVVANIDQGYAGPWKFFTYINMWIQILCFLLCVLQDAVDLMKFQKLYISVKKYKELVYASLAFPTCLVVFTSFWALYAIDRELVFPKHNDAIIPWWANHLWHTVILITIVEVCVEKHKYPPRKIGLLVVSLHGFLYLIWIQWVGYKSGLFVYPFLAHLSAVGFVAFAIVEFLTAWSIYLLGEFLNKLTGGVEETDENGEHKKH